MGDFDNRDREEVFSKKVRAGKRTYFFDVKATRSNDYYITVTESKKRLEDGFQWLPFRHPFLPERRLGIDPAFFPEAF